MSKRLVFRLIVSLIVTLVAVSILSGLYLYFIQTRRAKVELQAYQSFMHKLPNAYDVNVFAQSMSADDDSFSIFLWDRSMRSLTSKKIDQTNTTIVYRFVKLYNKFNTKKLTRFALKERLSFNIIASFFQVSWGANDLVYVLIKKRLYPHSTYYYVAGLIAFIVLGLFISISLVKKSLHMHFRILDNMANELNNYANSRPSEKLYYRADDSLGRLINVYNYLVESHTTVEEKDDPEINTKTSSSMVEYIESSYIAHHQIDDDLTEKELFIRKLPTMKDYEIIVLPRYILAMNRQHDIITVKGNNRYVHIIIIEFINPSLVQPDVRDDLHLFINEYMQDKGDTDFHNSAEAIKDYIVKQNYLDIEYTYLGLDKNKEQIMLCNMHKCYACVLQNETYIYPKVVMGKEVVSQELSINTLEFKPGNYLVVLPMQLIKSLQMTTINVEVNILLPALSQKQSLQNYLKELSTLVYTHIKQNEMYAPQISIPYMMAVDFYTKVDEEKLIV